MAREEAEHLGQHFVGVGEERRVSAALDAVEPCHRQPSREFSARTKRDEPIVLACDHQSRERDARQVVPQVGVAQHVESRSQCALVGFADARQQFEPATIPALVAAFDAVEDARTSDGPPVPLTYFEFGTLAAFAVFARAKLASS